ncbi:aminoglycoside phosphotransferase family protein [Saccharothrix sp. S26]|uniref:aminoglycoside phosphotransferase family protein n=1 Tax=Saccharothrix sp. S26 TaxID=2907215 RepID=UPI001F36267A|nr:aminoglycoside phosphotransferase family protein [Saccharothrix sp. S26]MCE6998908.1 aminoglycoside phosphotransferase family protein [Saccharothrix sp. S26]
MDIGEITARLTRRFGPSVAEWCARVPQQAAGAAARWDLVLGDVMPPGASSVVVACARGGVPLALKLSPDPVFLAEQASALRHFAPSGRVPAVVAEADGALLMEAVQPGTPADELPTPPSPRQWADLVRTLHAAPAPDHPWRSLRARCEEAYARIGRRLPEPSVADHISTETWTRAQHRCRALLDTQPQVLLHGDLHLGNVLDGGRTLVAIDPRPCVGDPCFDVVDYALAAAGHEGVPARATAVARAASLDPDRLHEWCRALAPMIAIAHLDHDAARTELLTLAR